MNDTYELALTRGYITHIDKQDRDRISMHSWYAAEVSPGRIVAQAHIKGKTTLLHRFLLDIIESKIEVDHIDGNPLNNARNNLRVCTHIENSQNRKKSANNSSGYAGVGFIPSRGKWRARITFNKKEIYLGYFDTKEQAAEVRKTVARSYRGEFGGRDEI